MEELGVKDNMGLMSRALKRAFDVVLSATLLVLLSPLFLAIGIMLKRKTDGDVFYRQERIGRGGRPFYIIKFCTMRPDSESDGVPRLTHGDDERFTDIGRKLSAHHLDELPQLWNVLKGDMSFVGYRPERQYFIDKIMEVRPDYEYLYQIRPGVTSMATIYNGYTDTIDKMMIRLQWDLEYLKTRTLWTDIQIIATTALWTVMGKRF